MKILIASDLHLTDKPEDNYRWGLFPWMGDMCKKHGAEHVLILGDITDSKDRHSSSLVNNVTSSLDSLYHSVRTLEGIDRIHVLMGNHDFIDKNSPFFNYLQLIPGIRFYATEQETVLRQSGGEDYRVAMIPYCREPEDFFQAVKKVGGKDIRMLCLHQTLRGSVLSNGTSIKEGLDVSELERYVKKGVPWLSGDVHVPQTIGKVEYVGSPYQIKFGDNFKGRVLLYDLKTLDSEELFYPTIHKWTIDVNSEKELAKELKQVRQGDMVKLILNIPRRDIAESAVIRRRVLEAVRKTGAILSSAILRVLAVQGKLKKKGQSATSEVGGSMDNYILFDKFCDYNHIENNLRTFGKSLITASEQ